MKKIGLSIAELLIFFIVIGFGWWTNRSLDWALTEWKHHPVHVPYWLALIVSFIGNGVTFAFDVVVEILRRIP